MIVTGFGEYAFEPSVLAPDGIDTAVPAVPPVLVEGPDGELLPHADMNPMSATPTTERRTFMNAS